jgi:hypothetical protein
VLVLDPAVEVSLSDPDEVSVKFPGFEFVSYDAAVLETPPAPRLGFAVIELAVVAAEFANRTGGRDDGRGLGSGWAWTLGGD